MPLPERPAEFRPQNGRLNRLVLVVAPSAPGPSWLGSQYVLGIFPVTRLSYREGTPRAVTEYVLQAWFDAGYDVATVDEAHLGPVTEALKPAFILRPSVRGLSLNAYDAIFLRILSISGSLQLEYLDSSGSVTRSEVLPVEQSDYRSTGYAPRLAYLAERAIYRTMQTAIPHAKHAPNIGAASRGSRAVIVPPPFASSPQAAALRLIQRGVQRGAALPSAATSRTYPATLTLQTAITRLPPEQLAIRFTLSDGQNAITGNCAVAASADALEAAARLLSTAFFTGDSSLCTPG